MELGGFAETKEVIDGTEEDLIAFNYCLAEDYLSAIREEDFEQLGNVGLSTIESILYWLNYDGTINKEIEDELKKIPTGKFITEKNRTLEEAVIENENLPFSEILIYNGNKNPRLYLIVMQQEHILPYDDEQNLINYGISGSSKEEYVRFLKSIFDIIEEKYLSLDTYVKKRELLEQIKPYIKGIKISKRYYEDESVKELLKIKYTWKKDINS